MAVPVIDTRGELKLVRTLEMMNTGHSGFSSLRLGASWSVGEDNWMQQQRQLCQS